MGFICLFLPANIHLLSIQPILLIVCSES